MDRPGRTRASDGHAGIAAGAADGRGVVIVQRGAVFDGDVGSAGAPDGEVAEKCQGSVVGDRDMDGSERAPDSGTPGDHAATIDGETGRAVAADAEDAAVLPGAAETDHA